MTITIISARYASSDHSLIDLTIESNGQTFDFTLSQTDQAEMAIAARDKLNQSNIQIDPFIAPPQSTPSSISDRQFFQKLAVSGIITQNEALAAVKTGDIPLALQNIVDQIADVDAKFAAEMILSGATVFMRDHPLTTAIGAARGMTTEQINQFFREASQL